MPLRQWLLCPGCQLHESRWPTASHARHCLGRTAPENDFLIGVAKGMRTVLKAKGINTSSLNGEQMQTILANHDDFKNKKSKTLSLSGV